MIFGNSATGDGGLGFSITAPFKTVAHAAVAAGKGTAHVAERGAKAVVSNPVVRLAAFPPAALVKYVEEPIAKAALKPVTNRINTLKDRRARKLAWDRRKSTTPTPQERSEARSWAKSYLRGQKPPFGAMLSLLAGTPAGLNGAGLGEPATATIAASVPALIALMNAILKSASGNGQAPEKAGGGGGGTAAGSGGGAADDSDASDAASGDVTTSGGGRGARSSLPLGLTKKQLTIGGAVLGGIVLIALLKR